MTIPQAPRPIVGDDVDVACGSHIPVEALLDCDSLPVRRTEDGVLVLTAYQGSGEPLRGWFPGERVEYRQADRSTVQELITSVRAAETADAMANGFTRRHPDFAAASGIRAWQKAVGCAVALAAAAALLAGYGVVLVCAAAVLFSGSLLFRVLLAALCGGWVDHGADTGPADDGELPVYTVLVPAYQEARVIGDTVRWLATLDYPAEKLEILVLLERRDEATIRAVRAVDPPPHIRIVLLPPGKPQTKPRSCNLGLMLARGELLVIFDAEDRPERDQLRKVARQFADRGDGLACVQARLNYYNRDRNWLTRMFSQEYAFWFDLMLGGLARLRLPVPLGGTSNHLRTRVLREVGGWDAWNVTEDADLGMRIAAHGYTTEIADSTTWEECPARVPGWIKQRTRWLKGYLLTLLVHTRNPRAALRRFGASGMVSLLVLVGGTPLIAMLWPLLFVVGFLPAAPVRLDGVSVDLVGAAAVAMWGSTAVMTLCIMAAARRRGRGWALAVFIPVYWLLHAYAGWRGLVQLIRAPYAWEKTTHGT